MNHEIASPLDLDLEPERYELREPGREPFLLDRRAFLKSLGGGLLVLCLIKTRDADSQQESGRRGGGRGGANLPRELSAWLHIDENGTIRACTGKVEVGQNIRTSLAQAVADELHVSLDSVHLVMGDTTRVPFDMGTFGSRSTPTMAPQLRRAAATARERLISLAADRLAVPRDQVTLNDRTAAVANGQSLTFAELTHGQSLADVIDEETPTTPADQWTIAGRSAPKVNGRDFVTGSHRYTSDITHDGMLRGKILRPPSYGSTLKSLDPAAARALPGVKVVHDGDFVGITAPDEPTAARALRALKADWSTPADRPDVSDATLFDHLIQTAEPPSSPPPPLPNAAPDEIRLEARYTIAYIAHAPLEPRAAVAEWHDETDPNSIRLTVSTGTQRPFGVRSELARVFDLPEERIRVLVPDTGSGYGGKHTGEAAIEAARLARDAGKPVKLVWTREEEFRFAYARPAGVIDASARARREGTLLDWHFTNINSGGSGLETPYNVLSKHHAFRNADSPLRQGSYRALASTANHFARESFMDELAAALGIDPLAFRLKNLDSERLRAVLEAVADKFSWGKVEKQQNTGRGIACGTEKGGFIATAAEVHVDPDPASKTPVHVQRITAAFECGAIVNPDHLRNQVEGAIIQGLGGALFESLAFADGLIRNPRFSRYRVPRFSDLPSLEIILIDRKDLPSAGAGETPIIAIAPAIANAIFDAVGVRTRSLPLARAGALSR